MKNKKGFTLLEVLVALTVLATFMAILQRQEVLSIGRKILSQEQIERVFLVKKQLTRLYFSPPTAKPKVKNAKAGSNLVKITTSLGSISKKSSLREFIPYNIKTLSSEGEWKGERGSQMIKLLTFILNPKEKKHATA